MVRIGLILAGLLLAPAVQAQEKIGNWKVDHFKPFQEWESFCDHRNQETRLVQRCYVRRVEVYSPRPKFGALYFFLTEQRGKNGAPVAQLEFGFEPGTQFHAEGFVIENDEETVYRLNTGACENGHRCWIAGVPARSLQSHLVPGNRLRFRFTDRRGDQWDIRWGAEGYLEALADFKEASASRGLPN